MTHGCVELLPVFEAVPEVTDTPHYKCEASRLLVTTPAGVA